MRRGRFLFPHGSILIVFVILQSCTPVFGQVWSGILAPSRAINWNNAGLPAILPDGETISNPWTPPTRTQCGSTISAGASAATINAALSSCGSGHYVLLAPGIFSFANANITMYAQNGVTLRGSGAQSTILKLTGSSFIPFGIVWNNGSCSGLSGFSQGSTSVTMNGCSGPALVAGELVQFKQCDTGFNGVNCANGSATDNGGLYVCGPNGVCSQQSRSEEPQHQTQTVYVNSISGSCSSSCTVSFTPGLYLPNWSTGQSPVVLWETSSSAGNTVTPYGNGLEDMTVDSTASTANFGVSVDHTYGSWIKGVRMVGAAGEMPSLTRPRRIVCFSIAICSPTRSLRVLMLSISKQGGPPIH